jgi:ABC-type glutathione transport system ATPase component
LKSKVGQEKKTVILVTNALQYLNHPMVDRIVVFQNGRVVEQGTYKQLAAEADSLFQKYLAVMAETGVSPTVTEGCKVHGMPISAAEIDSSIDDDYISENEDDTMPGTFVDTKMSSRPNGDLMTNEFKERAVGKVDSQVYFAWARAAGGAWLPFLILAVYGLVEVINVSSKWWLTYCT